MEMKLLLDPVVAEGDLVTKTVLEELFTSSSVAGCQSITTLTVTLLTLTLVFQ